MEYDEDKIDDAVLALLFLTMWNDRTARRAWKGHDHAAMDRLHRKGYIGSPRSKARSVVLTEKGHARAEELFRQLFGKAR
jgi:heme-degrading monooxygenase HmoA